MGTLKKNELILKSSTEFPCSYIKGRLEKRIFVNIPKNKSGNEVISKLTQKGFRRNYDHMYIPSCKNCISCISLRLNISKFIYSKSNKRNLKTNSDLSLVENKFYSEKRFKLFKQYCRVRHSDGQMKYMTQSDFINFFHKSKNMNYKSSFNNVEYFVNGEWTEKL